MLFTSISFAENPFDRADAILELGTDSWLPGSDNTLATTRLNFDPLTIELGETFKDFNHEYVFLATDLTIKEAFLKEIWVRPRLIFQPHFNPFNLEGIAEVQIGIHLNSLWNNRWEKDNNGNLKRKEINFWSWAHYGKEYSGRWNFGFWLEFYIVDWFAFKADFLGWGTQNNPISFVNYQTDIGVEVTLKINQQWAVTLLANLRSTGLKEFLPYSKNTKINFVWQIGIEFRK